jgi:phenylalanyl-tRNA synthetase alpha chain
MSSTTDSGLKEQLESLQAEAIREVEAADDLKALEAIRVTYLGRKDGRVSGILRGLGKLSAEERPLVGQTANAVKVAVEEALDARKASLSAVAAEAQAASEAVDLTLPGRMPRPGNMHVINQVTEEILGIFNQLGFQVATGPDIETEYYNFDALNTPADHPARDSHDTFFVKPGTVLRTHTSPVQMRVMEKAQPPVAIVAPGRVYRVDFDATHSPMFYQIEGLLVDEGVTFSDLKGTLLHFIQKFFGPKTQMRLRPHFFPFTEPSAEVDILWTAKDRHTGETKSQWLEILGCGMVHPEVFKHAGYDYEKYSGFAFGFGVDRMAMVRHGINSIHHLYENDLRFLEQF